MYAGCIGARSVAYGVTKVSQFVWRGRGGGGGGGGKMPAPPKDNWSFQFCPFSFLQEVSEQSSLLVS